jgi:hypothetical protein
MAHSQQPSQDNYGLLSQILCQKALHSFSLENIFCACIIIISPVGFAHSNFDIPICWLPGDYVPKFLPLPLAFVPKWWPTGLEIEISCSWWRLSKHSWWTLFFIFGGGAGGAMFFVFLPCSQCALIMFLWGSPSSQFAP